MGVCGGILQVGGVVGRWGNKVCVIGSWGQKPKLQGNLSWQVKSGVRGGVKSLPPVVTSKLGRNQWAMGIVQSPV